MDDPEIRPTLHDLWNRHLLRPIPPSSRDARVADVYVDLVDYDGYIAGIATHLLQGITPAHAPRPNPELRSRLARMQAELEDEPLAQVNAYLAHLDHLEELAVVAGRDKTGEGQSVRT